jgi:hypothetical protein
VPGVLKMLANIDERRILHVASQRSVDQKLYRFLNTPIVYNARSEIVLETKLYLKRNHENIFTISITIDFLGLCLLPLLSFNFPAHPPHRLVWFSVAAIYRTRPTNL